MTRQVRKTAELNMGIIHYEFILKNSDIQPAVPPNVIQMTIFTSSTHTHTHTHAHTHTHTHTQESNIKQMLL